MRQKFLANVLPSMLAFAFSGIYAIVDGFFVGRNVGDVGLAAINIAYPVTALIQSLGTGIGMGGAIQVSVHLGKGEKKKAGQFLGNTLLLLLLTCVLLTGILFAVHKPLLRLFGAQGEILTQAALYTNYIVLGAAFQVLGTGIVPIIRNFDGALTAMLAMIAGFVTNIILDWLFVAVLQYGMAGAAVATVMGQAVTLLPCLFYLFSGKCGVTREIWKPSAGLMRHITAVAVSPFGLTLSPNIVLMLMNKMAMLRGGDLAVAAYAVISYVICVIQLLLQGVGDGCQPLISRYFGEKKFAAVLAVRKMAYIFSVGTAAVMIVLIFLLRGAVPDFFGASQEAAGLIISTLPIFLIGFLFFGFLRVTTSYFYAIKENRSAYLLIYGEPVLLLLVLLILPSFLGMTGVWFSVPVTQICLACAGYLLLRRKPISEEA